MCKRVQQASFPLYLQCVCVRVSQSCPTLVTPWTIAHQAPLSMKFFRQEHWSELPLSSAGDLPNPGMEPRYPALQADSLPSEPPGKPKVVWHFPCQGIEPTWQAGICRVLSKLGRVLIPSLWACFLEPCAPLHGAKWGGDPGIKHQLYCLLSCVTSSTLLNLSEPNFLGL